MGTGALTVNQKMILTRGIVGTLFPHTQVPVCRCVCVKVCDCVGVCVGVCRCRCVCVGVCLGVCVVCTVENMVVGQIIFFS